MKQQQQQQLPPHTKKPHILVSVGLYYLMNFTSYPLAIPHAVHEKPPVTF